MKTAQKSIVRKNQIGAELVELKLNADEIEAQRKELVQELIDFYLKKGESFEVETDDGLFTIQRVYSKTPVITNMERLYRALDNNRRAFFGVVKVNITALREKLGNATVARLTGGSTEKDYVSVTQKVKKEV